MCARASPTVCMFLRVWRAKTLHPFILVNHSQLYQSLLTSSHQQRVQLWMIRSVHAHTRKTQPHKEQTHLNVTCHHRHAWIQTHMLLVVSLCVVHLLWCLHSNVWEKPSQPPPPSLNSHSAVAITMSSFHGNVPANTDGRKKIPHGALAISVPGTLSHLASKLVCTF